VSSIVDIEGDAMVISARGKKKYIYDLATTIFWKVRQICFSMRVIFIVVILVTLFS